jgi:8-oxo-dGTP pyrophosphatase MutT (NUDIX family)
MSITAEEISSTLKEYLLVHPDEADRLDPLTTELAKADELTSDLRLPGHVTVNAVLLDPRNRVLHIHHLALGRWLTPGGHCEPGDSSLIDAALRELQEETGIPAESVRPLPEFAGRPIDIDVHAIPANDRKAKPAHWHYDFRFAFRTSAEVGRLQTEEVTDFAWLPAGDTTSPDVARKLASVI